MRTLLIPLALALTVAAGCKSSPKAEPPDYGLAAEQAALAARVKFYDLLVQYEAETLRELVNAENELERAARKQLKPLVKDAKKLADKALKADSEDVRGRLAMADCLYLEAVCRGNTRNVFGGLKSKVRKHYRKAMEIDPEYEAGGAYRVKARYLIYAPWPKRDPELSERAAWAAADVTPTAENLLVLGDIQYLRGKRVEAARTWRSASQPKPHDNEIAADVRELATRRFRFALDQGVQPTLR